MKKFLTIVCLFFFGCKEQSEQPKQKELSFVETRNLKCLKSAKQVISNLIEVNCSSVADYGKSALCVSRMSKIKTVEFRCRGFDDASWYADNFNVINYDFKE